MWREGDSRIITDVETGATTQGEVPQMSLEMLCDAVCRLLLSFAHKRRHSLQGQECPQF